MLDKLSLLISDIECRVPNPDGTFAEVLEFLRELQRLRAALPKTADGVAIVPGMTIYDTEGCEATVGGTWFDTIARYPAGSDKTDNIRGEYFYSSLEAADRARGK